ncbi:MAG: nucleotide exchange factor GrpE [Pirellulales bacterium]|nr:nucleotide exchange factor GrpE [Pirellulales bacterium]
MSKKTSKKHGPDDEKSRPQTDGAEHRPKNMAEEKNHDTLAADAAAEIDRALDDKAVEDEKVTDELLTIRDELEESKDRVLRLAAELENYRKRVARQREEEQRYANLQLIRDLLPVLDNMQRAIEAAEKSENDGGLLQGFQMVVQLLRDVLKQYHCEEIEALKQPFDPHLHEAVTQQISDEHPANTVLAVVQTGYRLYDRVVRPSQVIVSKPPEE